MELTKEYFEQYLDNKLNEVEVRLIERIDSTTEDLAAMVKRGFDDMSSRLDLHNEVVELQRQMREVRVELNLA